MPVKVSQDKFDYDTESSDTWNYNRTIKIAGFTLILTQRRVYSTARIIAMTYDYRRPTNYLYKLDDW